MMLHRLIRILLLQCFSIALVVTVGYSLASDTDLVGGYNGGPISGIGKDDLILFRGILCAATPIDDLRWRPPQAVQPWDGVLAPHGRKMSANWVQFARRGGGRLSS